MITVRATAPIVIQARPGRAKLSFRPKARAGGRRSLAASLASLEGSWLLGLKPEVMARTALILPARRAGRRVKSATIASTPRRIRAKDSGSKAGTGETPRSSAADLKK